MATLTNGAHGFISWDATMMQLLEFIYDTERRAIRYSLIEEDELPNKLSRN